MKTLCLHEIIPLNQIDKNALSNLKKIRQPIRQLVPHTHTLTHTHIHTLTHITKINSISNMPVKKSAEKAEKKTKAAKATGEKGKRALSPYILFCTEKRAATKAANPGASFGELGKLLGAQWAALDEKGRAVSTIINQNSLDMYY
jgi:hypothetical protein